MSSSKESYINSLVAVTTKAIKRGGDQTKHRIEMVARFHNALTFSYEITETDKNNIIHRVEIAL